MTSSWYWFIAAKNGDIETINKLLNDGFEVDIMDKDEYTALFYAWRYGHRKIVELLLHHGANIEYKSSSHKQQLFYNVVEYGRMEMVKLILEKDVDINGKKPFSRWTVLGVASENRRIDIIKLLLENGVDIENKDRYKRTVLNRASRRGYIEVVKVLLDSGAKIETKDKDKTTPLIWASKCNHLEVVKLLLESGANVNTNEGKSKYTSENSWTQTNGIYTDKNLIGGTSLIYASHNGYIQIVKILLESGANINITDCYGKTPFVHAYKWNRVKIIKLLLDAGADVDTKYDRLTILQHACQSNNISIIKLLLKSGADINVTDNCGRTPLRRTCRLKYFEVVKLLLENGAKPESQYTKRFVKDNAIKVLLQKYEIMYKLNEWRPWNHNRYPLIYRETMCTLVVLAKTINI